MASRLLRAVATVLYCVGVATASASECLYTLGRDSGTIGIYDPLGLRLAGEIEAGDGATTLAVDADGQQLYAGGLHGITRISVDGSKHRPLLATSIDRIVQSPEGGFAALARRGDAVFYTTQADGVARSVRVGQAPADLVFSRNGFELYVAVAGTGAINIVDVKAGAVVGTIELGEGRFPETLALSPDGRSLFVGSNGESPEAGLVHVVDVLYRKVVAEIAVGGGPRSIAFSRDGRLALVADARLAVAQRSGQLVGETVAVIDTETLGFELITVADYGRGLSDIVAVGDGIHAFVSVETLAPENDDLDQLSGVLQIDLGERLVRRTLRLNEPQAALSIAAGDCSPFDDAPVEVGPILVETLLTLGEADARAGRDDAADGRLQRAFDLARAGGGAVLGRVYLAKASRAWQQRDYPLAGALYKDAVRLLRGSTPLHTSELASALAGLGLLRIATGSGDSAKALLDESVALLRQSFGADHLFVALAMNNLVLAEMAGLGECVSSEEVKHMLSVLRRDLGPLHPYLAEVLSNVALLYQGDGRFDDALALQREAVEIRGRVLPLGDASVGRGLLNLATALTASGELEEAKERLKEGVRLLETALGADHPDVVLARSSLVSLSQRAAGEGCGSSVVNRRIGVGSGGECEGAGQEVAQEFRDAAEVTTRELGQAAPVSLAASRRLADALQEAGRHAEAVDELDKLVSHFRKTKPHSREVVHLLHNLGFSLLSLARVEAALAAYRESLEIARAAFSESDPDFALSLQNLGQGLFEVGRCDEAEPLLREHLRVQESRFGRDATELLIPLNTLAQCAAKLGRADNAVALSQRAAAIGRASAPGGGDVNALVVAAESLNQAGNLVEAEAGYREVLTLLVRPVGHAQSLRMQALIQLAGILNKTERSEEALGLIEEAAGIAESNRSPKWVRAIILGNLAGTQGELGRTSAADENFRTAIEFAEASSGDRQAPGWILGRLFNAYADHKEQNGDDAESRKLRRLAREHGFDS